MDAVKFYEPPDAQISLLTNIKTQWTYRYLNSMDTVKFQEPTDEGKLPVCLTSNKAKQGSKGK